jgi:hypothetical protein
MFKGYKFFLEIVSLIKFFMTLESCKTHNLTKLKIFKTPFQESWVFCHFDVPPTTNNIIYYMEESDELFPNLNHGVY